MITYEIAIGGQRTTTSALPRKLTFDSSATCDATGHGTKSLRDSLRRRAAYLNASQTSRDR